MAFILFACDLDNTLLYSYKHKTQGDICVEVNKGQEQGFMTPKSYELLRTVMKRTCLVPVTTRSVEQYRRITWPIGMEPTYAVTTNGAILLKNSEIDEAWLRSSKEEIAPYRDEMNRLHEFLSAQNKYIRCRIVDDMYLFAYCKEGIGIGDCVEEHSGCTELTVVASGRKLYFLPPSITKGKAVTKLRDSLNPGKVICAGDSNIDLSMLDIADLSIVPNGNLAGLVSGAHVSICDQEMPFSQFVLENVLKNAIYSI